MKQYLAVTIFILLILPGLIWADPLPGWDPSLLEGGSTTTPETELTGPAGSFGDSLESELDNSSNVFQIINNSSLYNSLKGQIILQVEANGEAWYVHPEINVMYYLGTAVDAYNVMRQQGIGITTSDLNKIPIDLDLLTGLDTDGDGLPDTFEVAIGTDFHSQDTDGDGYNDRLELENNYSPLVALERLPIDYDFSARQAGKIFLQVEANGEAWYIYPPTGKRYYLGTAVDAFNIMRNLGLGISDSDFNSL